MAADLLCVLTCCALVACKPVSTETAADVVVVNATPRCEKIGVIQGDGGDAQHTKADAVDRAAERGATHILLDVPYWDLDTGITMVADGTLFKCAPPGSEFPPAGYPPLGD